MNKPLVSIIVPVYKVEEYLYECIESLLLQTYKILEIILIDDGSPDNSGTICDEFANKDNRIKVIHKINGGLSSARNVGLDQALGEYITFCDSDDVLLSNTISRYVEFLSKYECDVVSCESLLYKNGETEVIDYYHKSNPITLLNGEEYIGGFFRYSTDCSVCNKIYKRSIIGSYRFEEGKTNEDILFQYDVLRNCRHIVHINEGLYLYRINETGITHTFNKNSINVYYNAVVLHEKVKVDIPLLEEEALFYAIFVGYNLAMRIKTFHYVNKEPFKKVYSDIRELLLLSLLRIITSSLCSWSNKMRFIYLLIGTPCYTMIKGKSLV